MKKLLIALFVTFIFIGTVKAYSNNEYTIDIPEGYKATNLDTGDYDIDSNETFMNDDGNAINITVVSFTKGSSDYFTEDMLNEIADSGCNIKEDQKELIIKNLKDMYGDDINEKEIEKYANSYICMGVKKKEIIKSTKNNYRSYHIIFEYGSLEYRTYTDAYLYISNNKIYTVSLSASSMEELESDSVKNIINSFTIKNYKEGGTTINPYKGAITRILMISVVGALAAVMVKIRNKNNKKMQ